MYLQHITRKDTSENHRFVTLNPPTRHLVAIMCNDRSWKSSSIVTIVFTSMLTLGMFIAVGVMNSMFGDNMQCYVDAAKRHRNHDHRRQMFEGMDKIAAQHPSIAKTLGSAVKQLPAFRSFAPEGRKLQAIENDDSCMFAGDGDCDDTTSCSCGTDVTDCGRRTSRAECAEIPNDDSCMFAGDGDCDDKTYGHCLCGTDKSDCGWRSSHYQCQETYSGSVTTTSTNDDKTDEEKVEEVENVRCRHALPRHLGRPHQFLPSLCPGRA